MSAMGRTSPRDDRGLEARCDDAPAGSTGARAFLLAQERRDNACSRGEPSEVMFDPGSKARLTPRSAARFAGDTLFERLGRAVCAAGCLPRKELYESWEVARRVRRRFRGGRVVDLAAGHGLLAHALLLLDPSSSAAFAVDVRIPESAVKVTRALVEVWPALAGRVTFVESALESFPLRPDDLVVSAHACGALTDLVLERAVEVGARVAVLPCCQHLARGATGGLEGWLEGSLAVDVRRATELAGRGYRIHTVQIPREVTPKNRLLLGAPAR